MTTEFDGKVLELASKIITALDAIPSDASALYYFEPTIAIKCEDETVAVVKYSEVGDWYVLAPPSATETTP